MAPAKTLLSALLATGALSGCRPMIDRLVFFPDSFVGDPPAGVVERRFTAVDGVRLHAWYAAGPGAKATLVWSHGNAGNIAGRAEVLAALASRGLNVLAYDYRGYGKSEGWPSEAGVYLDSLAAFDSERERGVPAARIVCFGESLGGAVSISLATQRPCAAVVVVSTFTSLREVARAHYGGLAFLTGSRFDSVSRVGRLEVPVFVAHGDRDAVVPYALGERLFESAREPKRFLRVRGAGHNDVFENPALLDEIARFVGEHVAS